jgi:HJR/Mrr/RecB family endonuclease
MRNCAGGLETQKAGDDFRSLAGISGCEVVIHVRTGWRRRSRPINSNLNHTGDLSDHAYWNFSSLTAFTALAFRSTMTLAVQEFQQELVARHHVLRHALQADDRVRD